MEKYLELLPTFLEDPSKDKGESKLKVIQEITENFEVSHSNGRQQISISRSSPVK